MLDLNTPEMRLIVSVLRETATLAQRIQRDMMALDLTKKDTSPVTVADFTVQAVTAQRLFQAFPDAILVAEEDAKRLREAENAAVLDAVTRYVGHAVPGADSAQVCAWIDRGASETAERFWTLDPIDGTKGYLRGDQYAVAFAMIDRGRVMAGGLACPGLDATCAPASGGCGALAVAQRGEGAWCAPLNAPDAPWMPMSVSQCAAPCDARLLRSFESGHTNIGQIEDIAARLGIAEGNMVGMDSQAKYAALAAGKGELLFRLLSPTRPDYRECIWDHAAGVVILEEAGGRVTDLNGKPFDFTRGRRLTENTGLFASNGRLHDVALRAVAAATA